MQLQLGRLSLVSIVILGGLSITASCASSEDGGVFDQGIKDGGGLTEDASSGGTGGGFSTGGFSTGGFSTGGFGTGGSSGFGSGGDPTGGVGASPGAGGTPGTCNPMFCPSPSVGTACCVTANGPCGTDTGVGCSNTPADI